MAEPRIIYAPEARADFLALETYNAANDGEARAELIAARIDQTIINLAYMPGMGRQRPYLDAAARVFAVSPWLIVYTVLPELDGILVLRIVDGRRDVGTVFPARKARRRRPRQ